MDLEKMTVTVRPRKNWEAIDLGVALVQQNAWQLYRIWMLVTLPVFFVASLLWAEHGWLVYFIFWWLKPLWERPMLHFLSRQLFGEKLSVWQCVKSFFSLAKIQWFASLTWRRMSFTRSLDLPIIQLEYLNGQKRSQRLRVLHSSGSSAAVWLTLMFIGLESVFYIGFIVLAYFLIPQQLMPVDNIYGFILLLEDSYGINLLLNGLIYISVSLVAPFYTACGFALYLNQRTCLEAWDVELAFKRLAKRLSLLNGDDPQHFMEPAVNKPNENLNSVNGFQSQHSKGTTRLAGLLLGIVCLVSAIQSDRLMARTTNNLSAAEQQQRQLQLSQSEQSQSEQSLPNEYTESNASVSEPSLNNQVLTGYSHNQIKQSIDKIVTGEEFNQKVIKYRIERREPLTAKSKNSSVRDNSGVQSLWNFLGYIISIFFEFVLWVLLALLVIFLISKYRHILVGVKGISQPHQSKPSQLFGLNLSPESIPERPWLEALKLLDDNQIRESVSLLYRATLVWYMDNSRVVICEGDTELECLQKIERTTQNNQIEKNIEGQAAFDFTQGLTEIWRKLAYAHRTASMSTVKDYCKKWPDIFVVAAQRDSE
ncbi:hypothetical protein [Aliikangiella maris]|uniref:DUF4129 domain-containing protein n=2 Tax=Aliikangiella maris TaxID=3162458 RepID=A0ABV3MTI3_9GAMM